MRRTFISALTQAGITLSLVTALALPAWGATIHVTTKADVIANDGFCSLREAVTATNTNAQYGPAEGECPAGDPSPTFDRIVLPKGKFRLTLGSAGDNLNLGGDLDVIEPLIIRGAGQRKTIIENRLGSRKLVGDGDRLFHTVHTNDDPVHFQLQHLSLRRGDVGCSGIGCEAGGSAIEIGANGTISIEDCALMKNTAICLGPECGAPGHTAVIRRQGGRGPVTLLRTLIAQNSARCEAFGCHAGSAGLYTVPASCPVQDDVDLRGSRVEKNVASCTGDGCILDALIHVLAGRMSMQDTVVARNRQSCRGTECQRANLLDLKMDDGPLTVDGSSVSRNALWCTGDMCRGPNLLRVSALAHAVTLRDTAFTRNTARCTGIRCNIDNIVRMIPTGGPLTIERVAVTRNQLRCDGAQCDTDDIFTGSSKADLTVLDLLVTKNRLACHGDDCDTDDVVDLHVDGAVSLTRATITRNLVTCSGPSCDLDRVLAASGATLFTDQLIVSNNRMLATGFDNDVDEVCKLGAYDGAATILASRFERNRMEHLGDQGDVENVLTLIAGPGSMISDTTIAKNRSRCDGIDCTSRNGGGLQSFCEDLTVVASLFEKNVTASDGGAISNPSDSLLTLVESVVADNTAGNRGGAIMNEEPYSTFPAGVLAVIDSTIVNNKATTGGGIFNDGTVTSLTGTIFNGNTPAGSDCVNGTGGTGCP